MKEKILFVNHCFLNDATKLKFRVEEEQAKERKKKRAILKELLTNEVEIIQLPCPEFILYGSNRWGHTSTQFDTPHFREMSKEMLKPYVLQIEEYLNNSERFEILGVVGINGSPSCGVNFTYVGSWGGELSSPQLSNTLTMVEKAEKPGIYMGVFQEMLQEKNITIPFYSIETCPTFDS